MAKLDTDSEQANKGDAAHCLLNRHDANQLLNNELRPLYSRGTDTEMDSDSATRLRPVAWGC
jgi:hypothetical protein